MTFENYPTTFLFRNIVADNGVQRVDRKVWFTWLPITILARRRNHSEFPYEFIQQVIKISHGKSNISFSTGNLFGSLKITSRKISENTWLQFFFILPVILKGCTTNVWIFCLSEGTNYIETSWKLIQNINPKFSQFRLQQTFIILTISKLCELFNHSKSQHFLRLWMAEHQPVSFCVV